MQSTDRRTFVGGPRIFSDTYNLCPPPPIRMEDKIFSVSVRCTSTVEFIKHYSSCNMLLPHSFETSNIANFQMFDSERSENNTEWPASAPLHIPYLSVS